MKSYLITSYTLAGNLCNPVVIGAVILLTMAGCATPRARIRRNPQIFESLAPQVQKQVEAGTIEIGFPKKAVFLALGKPDRTYERTTDEGTTRIWSYVRSRPAYRGLWDPYYPHHVLVTTAHGTYWHDTTLTGGLWYDYAEREYEYLRIEFKDGEVAAIERLDEGENK